MSSVNLCAVCKDLKTISFRQLILWEKPQATGAVVGLIAAVLMVFGLFEYTMVTFVCRLLEISLAICGVMMYRKWIDVSVDDVKQRTRTLISDVEPIIITVVEQLFRIITWEDTVFSLKVFLVSIAVAFFGNIFSDLTFAFVATVLLFAVPVAYVNNKSTIDPQIQRASTMLNQYVSNMKPKTA